MEYLQSDGDEVPIQIVQQKYFDGETRGDDGAKMQWANDSERRGAGVGQFA